MKSIYVCEETAKEICVEVKGIEEYKETFLIIFNNVRNDCRLICVENDSGNNIYVTATLEQADAAQEWLSGFGEIKHVRDVLVMRAEEPEYNLDKFDDVKIIFE